MEGSYYTSKYLGIENTWRLQFVPSVKIFKLSIDEKVICDVQVLSGMQPISAQAPLNIRTHSQVNQCIVKVMFWISTTHVIFEPALF